jgi:regulator of protease activity HflC (stomatin/prohibitin superfamily)
MADPVRLSPKKIGTLVGAVVALIFLFRLGGEIFETNNQGYYQVKQAAVTGEMTVRNTAGTYGQWFGTITTYHVSDMLYFSKSDLDGGKTEANDAIEVRFNGGGTAKISGTLKFRLSTTEKDQLALHQDYKTYESVKHDLIRQTVQEALNKTAALMKAEESYSTRLADFTKLAEDQIRYGVYDTVSRQVKQKDSDGNELVETVNEVKTDADGKKVLYKPSPFTRYNVEVISFTLKGFEFDGKTQGIIDAKKDAEQAKVVARANAEKAQQDAITTAEQGKARVAKAEADALVEKKTAVINAERETAVKNQERLQAEQEAKAAILQGEAAARVAKLKVAAGLTPMEQATIQKDTAIGVARELSNLQLPQMMVFGGSGGSSGSSHVDPFTAIGLDSFMKINERLSTTKVATPTRRARRDATDEGEQTETAPTAATTNDAGN